MFLLQGTNECVGIFRALIWLYRSGDTCTPEDQDRQIPVWEGNQGQQVGWVLRCGVSAWAPLQSILGRRPPPSPSGSFSRPLPTTQEKTLHLDITRWSIRNQIDCILCSQRWRSSIQSAKTRLGADCGSDHKFLIAKLRLKLKKVEETPRPVRYDLNQIPYDYTVEVTNRFKGLDLIEHLTNYGWKLVTLYRRQ